MKLHELSPVPGSKDEVKRIGRGHGSGWGKTAGKGHKGQKARAGRGIGVGFEGGQMPLQRRVPKRGFNNIFAKAYTTVNVGTLESLDNGTEVTAELLLEKGIISKINDGLKILGNGTLSKKLTIKAVGFTAGARQKIEAAGGKAEVV